MKVEPVKHIRERDRAWWKDAKARIERKNMTAGGKRKGAGRKPRSVPRETLTIRIEPEHAETFRSICKASGKSQSEQLTEFINQSSPLKNSSA